MTEDKYLWRAIYEHECYALLTKEQQDEIDYKIATYLLKENLVVARDNALIKYREYFKDEDC